MKINFTRARKCRLYFLVSRLPPPSTGTLMVTIFQNPLHWNSSAQLNIVPIKEFVYYSGLNSNTTNMGVHVYKCLRARQGKQYNRQSSLLRFRDCGPYINI